MNVNSCGESKSIAGHLRTRVRRWPAQCTIVVSLLLSFSGGLACGAAPTRAQLPRYPLAVRSVQTFAAPRPVTITGDSTGLHVEGTFPAPIPCMSWTGYVERDGAVLIATIERAIRPGVCQLYATAFDVAATAPGIPSGSYFVRLRVGLGDVSPIVYMPVDSAVISIP